MGYFSLDYFKFASDLYRTLSEHEEEALGKPEDEGRNWSADGLLAGFRVGVFCFWCQMGFYMSTSWE